MSELILTPQQQRERDLLKIATDMEKRVMALIGKHYEGHLFTCEVVMSASSRTGAIRDASVMIDHPYLSEAQGRYHIRASEVGLKGEGILRLCGEILERMDVPRRSAKDVDEIVEFAHFNTAKSKEVFKCR